MVTLYFYPCLHFCISFLHNFEEKKKLQERNQGKWVCGRNGFVAVVALFKSDPLEGNIKTC